MAASSHAMPLPGALGKVTIPFCARNGSARMGLANRSTPARRPTRLSKLDLNLDLNLGLDLAAGFGGGSGGRCVRFDSFDYVKFVGTENLRHGSPDAA